MPSLEVYRAFPAECVGIQQRNKPAMENPVPITVTVYRSGTRDVACPFLQNGNCTASQRGKVVLPFERCIQLFPGTSNPEKPLLTKGEIDILRRIARDRATDIAQETYRHKGTIKGHLTNAYRKLDVDSQVGAILACVNMGILDLSTLIDEENVVSVCDLTPRQKDILRTIVEDDGRDDTNDALQRKLGISKTTVKNHFLAIYSTLSVGNRTQAALLYLAAQRKRMVD